MMKTNYPIQVQPNKQRGIALITVMVVLFVLTLLGLAATDSSNFQALMVRNNQFRLEAFNVSRSEIQDQIVAYNDDADKEALFYAIDVGSKVSTENAGSPSFFTVLYPRQAIDQNISLQRIGGCVVEGNTLGTGLTCSLVQLDSDASLEGTNIQSQQSQTFSFLSF